MRLFFALLTLFFLSGPAIGGNSDFWRCNLAAKTIAHIGGENDCVARTALRMADNLGANLNVSPIFDAATNKSINGIGRALNIIENNSNMTAAFAPVRLSAATPGEYAVIMEQHMMHATVAEDGIKLFDSSIGVSGSYWTNEAVNALKGQLRAWKFELRTE